MSLGIGFGRDECGEVLVVGTSSLVVFEVRDWEGVVKARMSNGQRGIHLMKLVYTFISCDLL